MIVVNAKLISSVTGEETDMGTVIICNDGTLHGSWGNYNVRQMRKGFELGCDWWHKEPVRRGVVNRHARLSRPIWSLVARALKSLGHD